jgi:hypothetical protein
MVPKQPVTEATRRDAMEPTPGAVSPYVCALACKKTARQAAE